MAHLQWTGIEAEQLRNESLKDPFAGSPALLKLGDEIPQRCHIQFLSKSGTRACHLQTTGTVHDEILKMFLRS